jgi:hypothetical protein
VEGGYYLLVLSLCAAFRFLCAVFANLCAAFSILCAAFANLCANVKNVTAPHANKKSQSTHTNRLPTQILFPQRLPRRNQR